MFRTVSAALLLAVLSIGVSAQGLGPKIVTGAAVVSAKQVARGGRGVLNITLKIAPGFHLYANPPSDPDLIPVAVTGHGPKGIVFGKPHYPAGKPLRVSYKDKPLTIYSGATVIAVPFTVTKSAKGGTAILTGIVTYQGCNATSCYPPASISVHSAVAVP